MDTAPLANHRMVLVFGNNPTLVQRQLAAFQKDSSSLAKRDLIIKQVKPCDNLYQTHHVIPNEPFTVILIGKDGGEKFRSTSILSTSRLFAMVDAMPMRQAEIRRSKKRKEAIKLMFIFTISIVQISSGFILWLPAYISSTLL